MLGLLGVDGVRTVGPLREKLLREFTDGLRLILGGVRLICGTDREGLLIRGRLIEDRGVDMRGIDREGLLTRGRLIEGCGAEARGASAEGRLGAGLAAALLAALLAAGLRRDCPCTADTSHRTVATARIAAAVLDQVFFF